MEAHTDPICVIFRPGRLPADANGPVLLLATVVTGWAESMTIHDEAFWGPATVYEAVDAPADALVMVAVL